MMMFYITFDSRLDSAQYNDVVMFCFTCYHDVEIVQGGPKK